MRVWTGVEHRYLKFNDFNSQWFGKVKPYNGDNFDRVKEEAVTLLKYIHELETAEIVAAIKKINEFKLAVTDYLELLSIW